MYMIWWQFCNAIDFKSMYNRTYINVIMSWWKRKLQSFCLMLIDKWRISFELIFFITVLCIKNLRFFRYPFDVSKRQCIIKFWRWLFSFYAIESSTCTTISIVSGSNIKQAFNFMTKEERGCHMVNRKYWNPYPEIVGIQ